MKLEQDYQLIKEAYKANELEGKPRTFKDLKSAILCSVIEHSSFWVDEHQELHTFIQGNLLRINIVTNETQYKFRQYENEKHNDTSN